MSYCQCKDLFKGQTTIIMKKKVKRKYHITFPAEYKLPVKAKETGSLLFMNREGNLLPPPTQAIRQTIPLTQPYTSYTTQALRVLIRKPVKQTNAQKHERLIRRRENKSFATLHQYPPPCFLHLTVVFG